MDEEIHRRRCEKCGKRFTPRKKHYRFCGTCYNEIAPLGSTTVKPRAGGAARRHGGISRLWAGQTPVLHRPTDSPAGQPSDTTREILKGFEALFTAIRGRHTRLSAFLRTAGLSQHEVDLLRTGPKLDSLVMRLCPKLRNWLRNRYGWRTEYTVIYSYELYGDERYTMAIIASDLGITQSHARALRGWALKQLRRDEDQAGLEEIVIAVARDVLEDG